MPRHDISMPADAAIRFIEEGHNLQVATLSPSGQPHLTTVWYVVEAGRITFHSFTKSQRSVNLRRDPRVTVLVEAGDEYSDLRGVMVQGSAELDQDPDRSTRMFQALSRKYQGLEIDDETATAMWGPRAVKDTVVTVIPQRTISWDHRLLGGSY
jgi:PPOX class probable F420-dependent enzyme